MTKLTLGFSPCPNDTFIFDAMVHQKINTGDLEFEVLLADVQTLNQYALEQKLDFTKLSYGVLPRVLGAYELLNSGSALGTGVGPLLIAKNELDREEINNCNIAIPGENTTAHLLFALAFPEANNKVFLNYDQIEKYVLESKSKNTAGVIIHENRFTYMEKGLIKIIDLGDFWQEKTGTAIPLGGIVGKRSLPKEILTKVDALIRQSIEYAFGNYPVLPDYVKKHASEMSENIMRKHIDLYVNEYSLNLGEEGTRAVKVLLDVYNSFRHEVI